MSVDVSRSTLSTGFCAHCRDLESRLERFRIRVGVAEDVASAEAPCEGPTQRSGFGLVSWFYTRTAGNACFVDMER